MQQHSLTLGFVDGAGEGYESEHVLGCTEYLGEKDPETEHYGQRAESAQKREGLVLLQMAWGRGR